MAKKKKSEEFTEMQLKFVYFYCSDEKKNGAEAARKAGYSEKSAKQKANTLLKDKKICALIHAHEQLKRIENEVNPKTKINSKFILEERIKVLENCKKSVPITVWDYETHKMKEVGERMLDPRSATVVLRDIELNLDTDGGNWTKEEKEALISALTS